MCVSLEVMFTAGTLSERPRESRATQGPIPPQEQEHSAVRTQYTRKVQRLALETACSRAIRKSGDRLPPAAPGIQRLDYCALVQRRMLKLSTRCLPERLDLARATIVEAADN
jgi:hypothetical protein